jgi:hypothetical protein
LLVLQKGTREKFPVGKGKNPDLRGKKPTLVREIIPSLKTDFFGGEWMPRPR